MRIYAVRYTGGVALAWLPIYQQIISKWLEDSRCGHRARECVQSAVLWTDCELGVALVDEQRTLPTFHGLHTNSCSKPAPVDRQLARRGSNQRRYDQAAYGERLPRAGPHVGT